MGAAAKLECVGCDARTGEREGRGHVAIRFGDVGNVRVYLDGDNVTAQCDEARAGDPGWVVLLRDALPCDTCGHPMRRERVVGNVVVERGSN